MQGAKQFKVNIAGTDLVIETGLLAQQAAGAVTVSYGDNTVFTAVTNTDTPREGIDFFPLQCEYREKFYAAGSCRSAGPRMYRSYAWFIPPDDFVLLDIPVCVCARQHRRGIWKLISIPTFLVGLYGL